MENYFKEDIKDITFNLIKSYSAPGVTNTESKTTHFRQDA